MFGFDFQVNAGIVLMLENIENMKSLRLEGNYEDIEIKLSNDQYILAQAKAIEKASSDFKNVRANLKKSVISLSEGNNKVSSQQLILITNSPNPLNEKASVNLFMGEAHRDYLSLPEASQELINKYLKSIEHPFDLDKFMIQVLPFETDNDKERYKVVRRNIDDFIGDLNLNIPGLGKKIMDIWHNEVFINASKKNPDIVLKKNDIIWPIMVIATDVERYDEDLEDLFEPSVYDEIVRQYKNIIELHCEKCEFFTKVLSDYSEFNYTKKLSGKPLAFAQEKWQTYLTEFEVEGMDPEIVQGLIQIILFTIVRNRIAIDRIKKGVNL